MTLHEPAATVRDNLGALLPRLRRFARVLAGNAHDADDLVQIALERALARASQWRPEQRLEGWVFGIVRTTVACGSAAFSRSIDVAPSTETTRPE